MEKKKAAFSLIELVVVIAVMAAMAGVIIPMLFDLRTTARETTLARNIQLWNQTYQELCSADPDFASKASWSDVSEELSAGVTANVGHGVVTFACQKPQFINSGDPTFVPGKGITAAP